MDLRNLKTIIFNFIIPFLIVFLVFIISDAFDFISPYYSLLPLLGMVAGPFGALASALSTLIMGVFYDLPLYICITNFIMVFLVSYFPYKLWYSYNKNNRLIRLDSSNNLLRLFGILLVSIVTFAFASLIIYYTYNSNYLTTGFTRHINLLSLSLYNYFNLGLLLIIIVLLIGDYFNVSFYYPGKVNIKLFDSFYDFLNKFRVVRYFKNHTKIFDYLLVIWYIICILILISHLIINKLPNFYLSCFMFIFSIFILLKPIEYKNFTNNKKEDYVLLNIDKENKSFSLTEIFMVFFVIFIIGIVVFLLILYLLGLLSPINGLNYSTSFLAYLGFVFLFLLVFSFVLKYFENKVSTPLNRMVITLNKYFKGISFNEEDKKELQDIPKFLNRETEITNLSKILSKMNLDLEEYKEDIKILTAEQERINAELAIAHDIQDSFLPKDFNLNIDDLDISAVMIPAKAVGGDFYDFFMIDDNHFAFVIGDVSDKGVPAALFMVKSKQIIQSSILSYHLGNEDYSLEEIIYEINNDLCVNNDSCMFVTSWIGLIDLNNSNLTFVNAGHESPIIKTNGEFKFLETENDLVLGVMEDMEFNSHVIDLHSGDKILLYTDGVTDANNENKEFFGKDNLLKVVKENDFNVNDSINGIIDSVNDFTQNQEQFDDFTLLLVEFKS